MLRLIILGLLIAGAIYCFQRIQRIQRAFTPKNKAQQHVKLIACEHCGLHVPEAESVIADSNHFCSSEHHQAWIKQREH